MRRSASSAAAHLLATTLLGLAVGCAPPAAALDASERDGGRDAARADDAGAVDGARAGDAAATLDGGLGDATLDLDAAFEIDAAFDLDAAFRLDAAFDLDAAVALDSALAPDAAASTDAAAAPDAALGTDAATTPDAGGLAPGYAPPLVSRGGPLLSTPYFATLTYAGDTNRDALEAYGTLMASDPWWAPSVSEYGIGPLTSLGNVHLTDTAPAVATQAQIETYLLAQATAGTLPRNPSGTYDGVMYMLYFPAGVSVTLTGGAAACSGWHGVHGEAGSGANRLVYALAIDCGPGRGFDALGYLEAAASHELIEAATDPYVDSTPAYQVSSTLLDAWSIFGELTDRCVGQYLVRGTSVLARNWSNAAGLAGLDPCVPAPAGSVHYGVWTTTTTVHGAAGTTLDVPITGFARGAIPDFSVSVYSASGPNTMPRLGRGTLNDGVTTMLTLTLPAGTPSGRLAWVVINSGPTSRDRRNYPIMIRFD